MKEYRLRAEGLREAEIRTIERLLERSGCDLSVDEDGTVVSARPDVMTRSEFRQSVSAGDVDSMYYGGVVWGRLQILSMTNNSVIIPHPEILGVDPAPLEFIYGMYGTKRPHSPNLLVQASIAPTVDWLESVRNIIPAYLCVNTRMIRALKGVVRTLPVAR